MKPYSYLCNKISGGSKAGYLPYTKHYFQLEKLIFRCIIHVGFKIEAKILDLHFRNKRECISLGKNYIWIKHQNKSSSVQTNSLKHQSI